MTCESSSNSSGRKMQVPLMVWSHWGRTKTNNDSDNENYNCGFSHTAARPVHWCHWPLLFICLSIGLVLAQCDHTTKDINGEDSKVCYTIAVHWTEVALCGVLPAGYVLNIASIVSAVRLNFSPLHPSVCLMSDCKCTMITYSTDRIWIWTLILK